MGNAAEKLPPLDDGGDPLRASLERACLRLRLWLDLARVNVDLGRLNHKMQRDGRNFLAKALGILREEPNPCAEVRALAAQIEPHDPSQAIVARRTADEAESEAMVLAQQCDAFEWRFWFDRLSEDKRRAYADKARAAGYDDPESSEAARGVAISEQLASQMAPEELAALGSDEGFVEMSGADLDRWAETGEVPWRAS